MFDSLPDMFSKVSLRKALGLTACFSALAGVCFGELLIFGLRLHPGAFDFAGMLLQTVLSAGLAVKFYLLTLSRLGEQGLANPAR